MHEGAAHNPVRRRLLPALIQRCSGPDNSHPGFDPAAAARFAVPELQKEGLRILIVEDHPDAARTLQELLEFDGHEVQVAYTGPDGVRLARRFLPQVVLCDIGLPGMDGWQVAITLRGEARTASARFIAISGYGTEEDRRRSEQAGFEAHMTKPLDLDALVRLLG